MLEKTKGYIAIITLTFVTGLSFLFVKIALVDGNPLDILAHRFNFALLALLPFAYIRRAELKFSSSEILKITSIAILYPVLFFSFQIFALSYISSSEAGIIQATSAIFILILAIIFLKEKISFVQVLFTCISVFGVIFIFVMQSITIEPQQFLGLLLMLLSVIAFSLYSILVKKNKETFSAFQLTFFCILLGFVFFNFLSIWQHFTTPNLANYFHPLLNTNYIFALLYLGVLSSLGSSFLMNYGYSKIDVSKAAIFGNLGIVVTIFAGVVFLKESLSWPQLVGAVVILVGVLGVNTIGNIKAKK
ncbi:transporter [Erysipelotrichaceae bacterium]|nr:transporter [Erysipelotrichaceae bacterium]